MPPCCCDIHIWLLRIQALQDRVGHFHSWMGYWGAVKPLGVIVIWRGGATMARKIFKTNSSFHVK